MSERDPLLALRGLIDEPIAPRTAFAEELRARLLTELGSHRRPAIDEERTMEITTPGLQLVLPGERARQLPSWRRIAEIAVLLVLVFGLIAVFASERANSPSNPPPTSQGNLGVYPPSFATPEPDVVNGAEGDLGVLWKIPSSTTDAPLSDIGAFGGVTFFLEKDRLVAVDSATGSINWKTSVEQGWGLLADAQAVYVTTSTGKDDNSSVLLKLDFSTGEELWSAPVGPYPGKPLLDQGVIYVWNTANTLYAIDAASGTERWHRDYSHVPMSPFAVKNSFDAVGHPPVAILDGESIVVGTSDARIGRIDIAESGEHDWLWSVQLGFDGFAEFEIATAGNAVAVLEITAGQTPQFHAELTAWDLETGEELWKGDQEKEYWSLRSSDHTFFVAEAPVASTATPSMPQQTTGITEPNYKTVALEPSSGTQLWSVDATTPVALSLDNSLLFARTSNVWTAAINAETGEFLGSAYPSGFISSKLIADDHAVYSLRSVGALVAIDINAFLNGKRDGLPIPGATPEAIQTPESGSALLWQTKPEGDVRYVGKEIISNGTIFRFIASSDFQGVEAFDSTSGALLWRQAVVGDDLVADENGVYVTTETYANPEMTVPLSPEALVFGPTYASIVALDPETGGELWTTDTGTGEAYPTLRDGTLYVLESDWDFNVPRGTTQEVSAIDTEDGTILWTQTIGAPIGRNTIDSFTQVRPTKLIVSESTLVAFTSRGTIVAMNRSTGETLWTRDGFHSGSTSFAATDTTLLVATDSSSREDIVASGFSDLQVKSAILAYDITTGDPLWAYDTGGIASNIAVADGFAVVLAGPSAVPGSPSQATPEGAGVAIEWVLIGIDLNTGTYAWQSMFGGGDFDRPPFTVAQSPGSDTIYVVSTDMQGMLQVVDPATGLIAIGGVNSGQPIAAVPVNDDSHVYIQLEDGTLIATRLPVPVSTNPGEPTTEMSPSPEADSALLWQTKPEANVRWTGPEVLSNGAVYRLISTSDFQGVEAYDTATGTLLWRYAIQGTDLVADDNGVYVTLGQYANPEMTISATPESFVIGPNDASVIKLDPRTGDELWSVNTGTGESSPVLIDGTLYLLESPDSWNVARGTTQEATAIDVATGSILWNEMVGAPMGQNIGGVYGRMVATNSNLVGLLGNGLMVGIDRTTGAVLWEQARFEPLNLGLSIDASGDTVVVSVYGATTSVNYWLPDFPELQSQSAVIAYNASDGTPLWAYDTGGVVSNVTIADEFVVVLAGPSAVPNPSSQATPEGAESELDWVMIGIDLASGEYEWKGISGSGSTYPPPYMVAQSPGADTIYVISRTMRGTLDVVDPTTGLSTSSGLDFDQPLAGVPVNDGSSVFMQLEDGTLVATLLPVPQTQATMEATPAAVPSPESDSALLWQNAWTGPDDAGGPKAFALANGMIYRFQADDNFHGIEAIDAITGEVKWQSQAIGDGIAADSNGVYVTIGAYTQSDLEARNQPDTVVALNPTTGIELWSIATGIGESEPIVKDGVLYIRETVSSANIAADFTEDITAIDTSNGEILWNTSIAAPLIDVTSDLPLPQHSMVVGESMIAIVASRGEIIGLNRDTGQRLWEQTGFPANATDLGISGDTLIASSYFYNNGAPKAFPEVTTQSAVVAIKLSDGTPLWSLDLGDLPTNIALAQGFVWVTIDANLLPKPDYEIATPEGAVSESDWAIVGIDVATGEIAHNGGGGGGDGRGPDLVAIDDSKYVLVVNSGFASFHVIEPTSGNSAMNNLYFGQPIVGRPLSDGERIYLQLQDGTIVAVNQAMPAPPLSLEDYQDLLPETGGPLPESVVWHVDQDVAWPPEALGFPLGGMAVSDGIVYRAVAGFSFESEETAIAGIEAYDASSGELLWQIPLHFMSIGNTFGDSITSGDGAVYVAANISADVNGPPTRKALIALDGKSGEERWRIEFEEDAPFTGPDYDPTQDTGIETMTYSNGVLYVANSSAVVTAFNSQTGDELWKSDAPPNRTMMSQAAVVTEGSITEVQEDATEGSQLSITVSGDRIFVVTQGGSVLALDVSTGELSGEATPSSTENTTAPVLIGNLLIVGNTVWDFTDDGFQVGKSGTLTAFDVSNNYAIVWEKQVGLSVDSVLAIGDALFVTTMISEQRDSVVQRIDSATGDALWSTGNLGQFLYLRNSIGPEGSLVVASFYEGTLNTIDPENGNVLTTSANLPALAIEPGDNGLYFATLLDGTLVAINPTATASTGPFTEEVPVVIGATPEAEATPDAIAWQIDGVGSEIYAGDLVVTGTTLIRATYTDSGSQLDAFNTQTSEPIWTQSLRWTGGLVLGDGLVYVPVLAENTVTGSIVALVPSTGEIVWEQPLDGRPIIPALVGDKLFVAADSGLMTALDAQSGEILWANHAYTEPLQGYAGPTISFAVSVSPKYVTALYPTGYFAVFDARDGKLLYQLPGYYFANTQYTVIRDTLIVLASLPSDEATPTTSTTELSPPMVLRGIDLANGEIIWESRVVTRMDEPMIVVGSSEGIHIQLIGEQIETQNGIYNENGFLPGGTISQQPAAEFTLGVAFQIDPATGEATYVSISHLYPYKYTGPLTQPGSIAIDYSQPPVGIDQPLLVTPIGDQQHVYLLLADGSVIAVKQEVLRGS